MRMISIIPLIFLAGCSGSFWRTPPPQVVCPHMDHYTKDEQQKRLVELDARITWSRTRITDREWEQLLAIFPKSEERSKNVYLALRAMKRTEMEERFLRGYGALRARLRSVGCKED